MNPKEYRDWMDSWISECIRYDQAMTQCMVNESERRTTMEPKKVETLQEKIDQFNKVYYQCTQNLGYDCPVRKTSACAQFRVKNADMRIIKDNFNNHVPALPRTMMSMAIDIATQVGIDKRQPFAMIYICSGFWKLICEIQKDLWTEQYEYRTEETEVDPLDKLLEEVLEIDQYCDWESSSTIDVHSCPLNGRGCFDRAVDADLYRAAISAFREKTPMPREARIMFENVASGEYPNVYHQLLVCDGYVKKILKLDNMLWASRIFQVPIRAEEKACEPGADDKEDTAGTYDALTALTEKVRQFSRHCSGEHFDPIHCPANDESGFDRCTAHMVSKKAYERAIASLLNGEPMKFLDRMRLFSCEFNPNDGPTIYICTPFYNAIRDLDVVLLEKKVREIAPKKDIDVAFEEVKKALLAASEVIKNTLDEQ